MADSDYAERLTKLFLRELETRKVRVLEQRDGGHFVLDIRGLPVSVALEDLAYAARRSPDFPPRL